MYSRTCKIEHTFRQPLVLRKEGVLFVKFQMSYNCMEEMFVTPAAFFVYVEADLVLLPPQSEVYSMHT